MIRNKDITKGGKNNVGFYKDKWEYIQKHFDEYERINGGMKAETSELDWPADVKDSEPATDMANDIIVKIKDVIVDKLTQKFAVDKNMIVNVVDTFLSENKDILNEDITEQKIADAAVKFVESHKDDLDKIKTAAASVSNIANTTIPTRPQEERQLNRGFIPADDGSVSIDLSKVVTVEEVKPQNIISPQPEQIMQLPDQNVPTAEIGTTEPKMVEVQPPKTQRSKKDLKEAAPKPTIEEQIMVDPTEALLGKYSDLQFVKDIIGDQFIVKFKENNGLIDVYVYGTDDPNKEIKNMGMTVDVEGQIFSKGAKFWPRHEGEDTPVDFKPAVKLTKEALTAYLSRDEIDDTMYNYNQNVADLSRIIDLRTLWNCGVSTEDAQYVMRRIKAAFKEKALSNKLGKRRMNMTKYTDKDHFVLDTPPRTPAYHYGPVNNTKVNTKFTFDGDKVTVK